MCHNILTISICIHCICNENLYCRHIKIGKCCPHLQNLYNIYHFVFGKCVLFLPLFVCLQCKLKLQVQSKHTKILEKKKKVNI